MGDNIYPLRIDGANLVVTVANGIVCSAGGVYDVVDYGAIGDGVTDDTAAIQAASDAMCVGGGGTIRFSMERYKMSGVTFGCNSIIAGNGATMVGSGNFIFGMSASVDLIDISGFTVDWDGVTGNQGREFFVNYKNGAAAVGENTTSFPDTTSVTIYDIAKLNIYKCALAFSKVTILGGDTDSHMEDNKWIADSTATTSPAYLLVSKGLINEVNSGVTINDNRFEVYAPSGSNQDIIKVTGGAADAHVYDNHLENTNSSGSLAQVDMFTGGNRARVHDNSFIDVQLHIKQLIGSGAVSPEMSYIDMSGNYFHISDGAISNTAMYLIGSKFSVQSNQFKLIDTAGTTRQCIHFDNSDDTGYDTDFPAGTASKANKVSGNMADLVDTTGDAIFLVADPGTDAIQLFTVNDNILLGGTRFTSGSMWNTAFNGNVWGLNTRGTGTGFFNSASGVAVGNLSDDTSKAYISSRQEGNKADSIVTTYSSGTSINADLGSMFWLSGTAAISSITGGGEGQIITVIGSATGASVVTGSGIYLDGSINMDFTTRTTLQLIKSNDGVWHETGRKSSYGTLPFEYAGDPNGNITASPGSICKNTNGGAGVTVYTKESGVSTNTGWVALTSSSGTPIALTTYIDINTKGTQQNIHGGIMALSTAAILDSGNNIVVSKNVGKMFFVINAGTDVSGTITVTGDSVNRDTGAITVGDTSIITVTKLSTDTSGTDANGADYYTFTDAYITDKWFNGSVTVTTTDLTITDIDTWSISFEQFNDTSTATINTLDISATPTNSSAFASAYLYAVEVTSGLLDISIITSFARTAGTLTADQPTRSRRGVLGKSLNCSTDGIFLDMILGPSASTYWEDITAKIWATVGA